MDENKRTVLTTNIEMRDKEIADYQINVDNYTRAIAKIDATADADEEMLKFKEVLQQHLKDTLREQMKSRLIRDVMVDQLAEMPQP